MKTNRVACLSHQPTDNVANTEGSITLTTPIAWVERYPGNGPLYVVTKLRCSMIKPPINMKELNSSCATHINSSHCG